MSSAPTPTPPMDERRLAEPITDVQIETWKRMSWGHFNAPVARMLDEIVRLREAGARETARLDWLEAQGELYTEVADYDCQHRHSWASRNGSLREFIDAARTPSPGDTNANRTSAGPPPIAE